MDQSIKQHNCIIDDDDNNNNKMFLEHQNEFWRSCDTEDWNNDRRFSFATNTLYFKIYKKLLNTS